MTTKSDQSVEEFELWLAAWTELTITASGVFTREGKMLPMTDEQRNAARTLPDVLDRLEESWAALPEDVRPSHFTYPVLTV